MRGEACEERAQGCFEGGPDLPYVDPKHALVVQIRVRRTEGQRVLPQLQRPRVAPGVVKTRVPLLVRLEEIPLLELRADAVVGVDVIDVAPKQVGQGVADQGDVHVDEDDVVLHFHHGDDALHLPVGDHVELLRPEFRGFWPHLDVVEQQGLDRG